MTRHNIIVTLLVLAGSIFQASITQAQSTSILQLQPGDHVVYIGNTLADRMQHHGWLETYVHSLLPEHKLTFRNLGFSGDEVKLRQRADNFGDANQWLTKCKADVVACFFGYNEALKGEAGVGAFAADLTAMIDEMRSQQYNGKSAPRLIVFSPIAHENLNDPNLPDGSANNKLLAVYTDAMRSVCEDKGILFVDLFQLSQQAYAASDEPLTMNGIHLLDRGNREIARLILGQFAPGERLPSDGEIHPLREAVLDKNYHWFSRYRVVDEYNVFGGRSKLAWFGQSNADVMMREMEMFDVMTENRDRRVWALARGEDVEIKDDNLPEELVVKPNRQGPLEGGAFPYLGGDEAIEKMTVHEGFQVNLFASEEQFPRLINPVQVAVDTDSRLWASVWPSYPHWNPAEPPQDALVILPDEDNDGKADELIVFADNLNSVTGFEFWGGGVLVAAPPEIWFLKDTDGDDQADYKLRILQGVSSADTHHSANAVVVGPDGWLYWSRGIFNVAAFETPTKTYRSGQSGVHRFNPRTFEIEFHYPIGPNPHGDVFDRWGYQFANDGTSGTGGYVSIGKGQRPGNRQWFKKEWRPVAATGILSSSHFPAENQHNFLICNTIGFLGVMQYKVQYNGADISAMRTTDIVQSSDPNFRPVDIEVGGDGALYVADWHNALIGHMQHNMRDPNRDNEHGRIYRISAKGSPPLKPVKMRGKPISEVLTNFFSTENSVRYRTRLELSGRDTTDVVKGIEQFASRLDPANGSASRDEAQALLECLWVHEEHRIPNQTLLSRVLNATEPRVRAAAVRTLGHWGTAVEKWASILLAAANDQSALVRAEAVKAATSFEGLDAAEIIFLVGNQKLDPELELALNYATSQLNISQIVSDAQSSGQPLSLAAQTYVLRNASIDDLLKMERTEAVYRAILERSEANVDQLKLAIDALAKLTSQNRRDLLLDQIADRDERERDAAISGLGRLLATYPQDQLAEIAGNLRNLARQGQTQAGREAAMMCLMAADGSVEGAFGIARRSKESLREFLEALASMPSEDIRRSALAILRPLLFELPGKLAAESGSAMINAPGISVDYFEPNPRDVAIETLAKLKPKASGTHNKIEMNVPILGRRDQFALRFTGTLQIDRGGQYTFYSSSDDGSRIYIGGDLVVNFDGLHGMGEKSASVKLSPGMHPLVVTYFDNGGGDGLRVSYAGPGIKKQEIPSSKLFVAGSDTIHDVAIRTLASIPGFEEVKFQDLATLIGQKRFIPSAVDGILSIPEASWPSEGALPIAESLAAYVNEIPAKYRTQKSALRAMELTDRLASRLSKQEARRFRALLADLKVNVIRVGTVPERMIYDKERLVVQAGKPVEFVLANTDAMPHNFAITVPGALEEIGELAEATGRDKDAKDRHFIPSSKKILIGSRLLQPGESQALAFDAPETPGVYPYVCTYPGHWRRMFGALYVVADLKAYEANPEEYLADHPMPLKDELLKFTNRNTEWTVADLSAPVSTLLADGASERAGFIPREFEVGKSLFKAASCIACHKMGGKGNDFGPDLTKLDEKKRDVDHLLSSLVEPSKQIDEKYQSFALQLFSGNVVTGLIVSETPDHVEVIVNPLASTETVKVLKDDIELKKKLEVSTMPKGLLNKLSSEEILDLLAYVYAGGDKNHPLFKAK